MRGTFSIDLFFKKKFFMAALHGGWLWCLAVGSEASDHQGGHFL
jgi:hypothetical protein